MIQELFKEQKGILEDRIKDNIRKPKQTMLLRILKDMKCETVDGFAGYFGRALLFENKIQIKENFIMELQFTPREMKDLLTHEMCHLLADAYHKKQVGHSPLYKDFIEGLGFPRSIGNATMTPSSNKTIERVAKYNVYCNACGNLIGHSNRKLPSRLVSKCCKGKLVLQEV